MVIRDLSLEELVGKTRATYKGPLIVGEDLMVFDVDDAISVTTHR